VNLCHSNIYFLWIGSTDIFYNLAVAISTPFNKSTSSTTLMGASLDNFAQSLAAKLTQKTGKQFFVSFNLNSKDEMLQIQIHKRILEELKTLLITTK